MRLLGASLTISTARLKKGQKPRMVLHLVLQRACEMWACEWGSSHIYLLGSTVPQPHAEDSRWAGCLWEGSLPPVGADVC